MKSILLAAVAMGTMSSAAYAQPIRDWTGFFVGADIGYASGSIDTSDNTMTTGGALVGIAPDTFNPPMTFTGASSSTNVSGLIGGVRAGYNLQTGNLVYGIEGTFNLADINSSNSYYGDPVGGPHYDTHASVNRYGTVVGRAGIALDDVLLFVDGGLALANGHGDVTVTPGGPGGPAGTPFSSSDNELQVGYAVGGGIELALDPNWSVSAEYQYVDFGHKTYNFPFANSNGSSISSTSAVHANTVMFGINYRF